eukprot:GHVS01056170.1.p1 GENE.GHVS01056170.1~~GHVS01056170.1.p1  ORF type:complete len:100 (+),score=15.19 GHVS01056170.1:949-1248(+)
MISIANLSDINRPVELLSPAQQTAVAATGIIWCRYSMVIIPVNWNLFSVNVGMGVTGSYQLYRIISKRFFSSPTDTAAPDSSTTLIVPPTTQQQMRPSA